MENENIKLQRFIDAVNDEIDIKVSELLAEAETEKNRIIASAYEQSKSEAERHMTVSAKKTGNKYVRELSMAELEMKKEILRHREALSEKMIEAVKKKITEYRKTAAYADYLEKMLAGMKLNGTVEIRLAPDDMVYSDRLGKSVKSAETCFKADENIKLGGLSVYSEASGTIIDRTFDLAVEEQMNIFVGSNAFAD